MSRAEDDAIEALFASQRADTPAPVMRRISEDDLATLATALDGCDRLIARIQGLKDLGLRRHASEVAGEITRSRQIIAATRRTTP